VCDNCRGQIAPILIFRVVKVGNQRVPLSMGPEQLWIEIGEILDSAEMTTAILYIASSESTHLIPTCVDKKNMAFYSSPV
jgi:hypothetical protein